MFKMIGWCINHEVSMNESDSGYGFMISLESAPRIPHEVAHDLFPLFLN